MDGVASFWRVWWDGSIRCREFGAVVVCVWFGLVFWCFVWPVCGVWRG